MQNEIFRLRNILQTKDADIRKNKDDTDIEIKKQIQAVAEYYQNKEQKLLKHIHTSINPLDGFDSFPPSHNLINFTPNVPTNNQASTFLLAVELERMRGLYSEKENECDEIIVML